jgi:hypothetical protein
LYIGTSFGRIRLKAQAVMAWVKATSLIAMSLSLVGCLAGGNTSFAPPATGTSGVEGFRTTTEGPVSQSTPISANLRDNLEHDSSYAIGRRVALIIGNSEYRGSVSRLANPANDARDIAYSMEEVGFDVALHLDVTRDEMNRAILDFKKRLHESDVGLFYYAGHAIQVNGRNFMIPVEANLEITDMRADTLADYVSLETVEIDDVLGRMAAAEPDLNIVILDACRDNPFAGRSRGLSRGLAQTLAPRGTFVAYATAPGQVAEDGGGNNSPYTSALVEAVNTPGLKLEDVFKQVRRDVALETDGRQTPWENSSIFGDFYFTPPKPEPQEPPVTATLPPRTQPVPAPSPVVPEPPVTVSLPDVRPTSALPQQVTPSLSSNDVLPTVPARVQRDGVAPAEPTESQANRPSINRFVITP